MKNHKKPQQRQSMEKISNKFGGISVMLFSAMILTCSAFSGRAANVLTNPGFESSPATTGWTQTGNQTWWVGGSTVLVHGGANSLWMQGIYNGYPYISSDEQTIACAPGSTFTASAWFSQYVYYYAHQGGDNGAGSGLFGSDSSGQEDGWVEVLFLDSANNVLADYRSVILDPAYVNNLANNGATVTNSINGTNNIYLAWVNCQVTNQYDPAQITADTDPDSNPSAITNTLSSGQYMVAPPGTKYVQYRLSLFQAQYESGASYWDDCSLDLIGGPAPSVIGDLSPDGSKFFNITATNFTFNIQSASSGGAPLADNPTNGIQMMVNGQDRSGSLQFSGTPTDWNVTLPNLVSNQVYNISITVSNTVGLVSSASVSFDTFGTNNFIVSSEDYDYNSGQFIQNPIPTSTSNPNSYFGRAGVLGVDDSTYDGTGTLPAGSAQLVRTDGNVAFQQASDVQLPLYLAAKDPNVYNVALSYNNAGNWENYTRDSYPSGNYVVYARISGGGGAGVEYLNLLTSGYGTVTQTTNNLGEFILANGTDWNHYMWVPLTDGYGNLVSVSIPSGRQTLQLLSGGGENVVDFMFVPFSASGLAPAINNLNPPLNQGKTFLNITNISFSVSSLTSTIATNNVHTFFNGVDVSSKETFSGNNTNWNVSVPVPANEIINLFINVEDANGLSNSVTETFDTFSQSNLMIEAEDYDFGGGQFIDNPVPTGPNSTAADSYFYYPANNSANAAVPGVDYTATNLNGGEVYNYRPLDLAGTDVNTDYLRQKFINGTVTNSDYYVGWWNPGTWFNYTRTFPTNKFYVYGRLAGGASYTGTTLSLVTSGRGTANQTTRLLGSFADPTANGWQNWHWVPMLNTNSQMAVVSLGGVETLRATAGTGANANFYMFVVAPSAPQSVSLSASVSGNTISIKFPTQSGSSYTVLYSNSLTGGNWQPLSSAIVGDGSTKTVTDTMGQSQRFYKLSVQ